MNGSVCSMLQSITTFCESTNYPDRVNFRWLKIKLSCGFVKWYVIIYWYISKFACAKFQKNLTFLLNYSSLVRGSFFRTQYSVDSHENTYSRNYACAARPILQLVIQSHHSQQKGMKPEPAQAWISPPRTSVLTSVLPLSRPPLLSFHPLSVLKAQNC